MVLDTPAHSVPASDMEALHRFQERVNLILLLDHGGRAGSNFFQCLFDRHEELIAAPLVHYVYSYWQRYFGERQTILAAEAHTFIATQSYARLLYQEPEGICAEIIEKIGGSRSAPFDRVRFRQLIADSLKEAPEISRRNLVTLLYGAYAICRGFAVDKARYIMINDAVSTKGENMLEGFKVTVVDQALTDFPQARILALTRDPRAQYASTRHQMVNELGNNYNLHPQTWWDSLRDLWMKKISLDTGPAHLCLLYQVATYRDLLRKWQERKDAWLFLRNEDFNTNFVATMKTFCATIGIAPDPEWLELGDAYTARMMGLPWAGTGAYSDRYQKITDGPLANEEARKVAVGPSKYVTERWKDRLPAHEQALLERYFRHELATLGYPFLQEERWKRGVGYILSSLRPWSGEWAGWSWLKKSKTAKDAAGRIAYLLFSPPYYLLARLRLWQIERSGFFDRGFLELKSPPSCLGSGHPGLLYADMTPLHYCADRASWKLLAYALAVRLSGRNLVVSLAQPATDSRVQRLLSALAHVTTIPFDLADFRTEQNLHPFTERERLLLEIYRKTINADAGENFKAFVSRYIVDQWAHPLSAQLLATSYARSVESNVQRLFLEKTPVTQDFQNLVQGKIPTLFYLSSRPLLHDLSQILRYLKVLPFLFPSKDKTAAPALGRLAVQHVSRDMAGDFPGDFDWLPDSTINSQEIVYLIEGNDVIPPDYEVFCRQHKIEILIKEKWRPARCRESFRQEIFRELGGVFATLARTRFKLAAIQAAYGWIFTWNRCFFREQGIIAYLNVADTNLNALPTTHALESLGGLDLTFEFSATGYHAYMDAKPAGRHQYLCWGPLTESMIHDCQEKVPYRLAPKEIFHAGNMRLYMADRVTETRAADLNKIAAAQGKKKILVLDAATSHLKLTSILQRRNFYDALMFLIAAHPDDLFLIKPQTEMDLSATQLQQLDFFERQGNLILLSPWSLPHYLFSHVDLVIATPIYSSSFMEACAARCPAICFDQSAWPHVLRSYIPSFLLANDKESLTKAVKKLLSGSLSAQERSSLDSLCCAIDPYGDGMGHRRFADYISLWLNTLRETGSADAALPQVSAAYRLRHPVMETVVQRKKVGL